MTCFNVVNMENSPITRVIDEIIKEDKGSDSSEDTYFEKNIGMYQKSGHCYSDVKSFIPQVVALSLVALWFSDKKQNLSLQSQSEKKTLVEKRKAIISDIGYLSLRLKHSLQPAYIQKYKDIAQFLKGQDNIFILAKGTALYVGEFTAQKFCQISCIHAESYPSAEFRHGPLSMLDEDEKTAGKFISFNFMLFSFGD